MRDLFLRIRRYLNYPADTHGKVEEIWQRMRVLSESFQIKIATIENEIRYLKTLVTALEHQLNSIQDQMRVSLPWVHAAEAVDENPEFLLLSQLASFFQSRTFVGIGRQEGAFLDLLLRAGFEVYLIEPDVAAAEKIRDLGRFHVAETTPGSEVAVLEALAANNAIPVDLSVVKTTIECFDFQALRDSGRVHPQIVVAFCDQRWPTPPTQACDQTVSSSALIGQMRAWGYHWNLLLFRTGNIPAVQFSANPLNFPEASWGNFFFFKEYLLFDEAYRFLQGVLPRFQYQRGRGK
jgi:hypothetical protein